MPSQHTSRTTALTFGSCASTELLVYVPTWMIESMDGMVCVFTADPVRELQMIRKRERRRLIILHN